MSHSNLPGKTHSKQQAHLTRQSHDSRNPMESSITNARTWALAASLSVLSLVSPEQRFFLVHGPSTKSSYNATNNNTTAYSSTVLLSLPSLRVLYLSSLAALRLGKGCDCYRPNVALNALCQSVYEKDSQVQVRNAVLAVALALAGVNSAKGTQMLIPPPQGSLSPYWSLNEANASLVKAIKALAHANTVLASIDSNSATTVTFKYECEASSMWEPLPISSQSCEVGYTTLLHALKELDSSHNYEFRAIAIGAVLFCHPGIKLPINLINFNEANFGSGGDYGAIIKEFLDAGRLGEACALSSSALNRKNRMDTNSGKDRSGCVPYVLLDRLLLTTHEVINKFECLTEEDESDVAKLRVQVEDLEKKLQIHFSQTQKL